ncbi:hypothetical protein AgCh_000798 [Apium graveolens]
MSFDIDFVATVDNSIIEFPGITAAAYAGFDGSPNSSSSVTSKFSNDVALLLYGLYQQIFDRRNQTSCSWNGLDNMASTEAMRLFVKILECSEALTGQGDRNRSKAMQLPESDL